MEIENHLKLPPVRVLKSNGTSFYFASLIFSKSQQRNVARLYQLCRYIDDCADELAKKESRFYLHRISQVMNHPLSEQSELAQLVLEVRDQGVDLEHMGHLLEGALFDLDEGEIKTKKDLLIYCYRVAGVVGLMMCPLLGVKSQEASPYALDLGIAMQLTNICRDVLEDAQNGRCYLPETELEARGLTKSHLSQEGETPQALKEYIAEILELADQYYESGYSGLSYIPLRPRLCILVAGEVYRAIGKKIAQNNYQVLLGRTYLGWMEKIAIVVKTIPRLFSAKFWRPQSHSVEYHQLLGELPGIHGGGFL